MILWRSLVLLLLSFNFLQALLESEYVTNEHVMQRGSLKTCWILLTLFLIQIYFKSHSFYRLLFRWWARKRDIFRLVRNQSHHPQDTGGQTIPGPKLRCPSIPVHPLWPPAPGQRPHTETNPTTDAEQRGLCVHGQHATGPCLSGHLDRLRGP